MEFIQLSKELFPQVSAFLEPYEHTCVQLAMYVRKLSPHVFVIQDDGKNGDVTSSNPSSKILGLIYVDSTIFHCIPGTSIFESQEFCSKLLDFIFQKLNTAKSRVKCVSGELQATTTLTQLLTSRIAAPYQTNHYKLLTAASIKNPPQELSNDDQILRCTENDLEKLMPIQKDYLSHEVAPTGKEVSDAEVAMGLRQILKNQLCLALYSDDEPVAKANTNAIGINWIQLGGVYTHPLYRRNGYAWHLVSAICRRTNSAGKKAALFVKDINVPAMELYRKLGFEEVGQYLISYF